MYIKNYHKFTINEVLRKTIYFIRHMDHPLEDLERGFSCQAGCWTKNFKDAIEWQEKNGAIAKPKFDKHSKLWCYDPEIGLSSFGFDNEDDFKQAMRRMEGYAYDEKIALFTSDDYDYHAGLDDEDVFRRGTFLGFINFDTKFDEIIDKYKIK
jgi:hypothetical protein